MGNAVAKRIEYFYSVSSPWAYMGTPRLIELGRRHHAEIELRNTLIVEENGGIPMRSRPQPRQDYHQVELKRWSLHLGMPLNPRPRFYPTQSTPAALMVIAADLAGLPALDLSFALQRALWAEERDIADPEMRAAVADEHGFDGRRLVAAESDPAVLERWQANRRYAVECGVFGTPTYRYQGELFWGQDRLDFLDRALAE